MGTYYQNNTMEGQFEDDKCLETSVAMSEISYAMSKFNEDSYWNGRGSPYKVTVDQSEKITSDQIQKPLPMIEIINVNNNNIDSIISDLEHIDYKVSSDVQYYGWDFIGMDKKQCVKLYDILDDISLFVCQDVFRVLGMHQISKDFDNIDSIYLDMQVNADESITQKTKTESHEQICHSQVCKQEDSITSTEDSMDVLEQQDCQIYKSDKSIAFEDMDVHISEVTFVRTKHSHLFSGKSNQDTEVAPHLQAVVDKMAQVELVAQKRQLVTLRTQINYKKDNS
ncbi:unnamed protein product [Meganyctiphanes norvegica]|uniref:Uncharacterized protein n=1 Tax=Meganyctiphanes norvegica TaxID=48144 RepID=A0AAV2RPP9_MEGNR